MPARFSDNARMILERRYLRKNEDGKAIESPALMFQRVASHVAGGDEPWANAGQISETEKVFFQMLSNLWFLPNSPTLMNAGSELGQLAACFVLPVKDSMESIFDAVKHTAIIHKSGGGTGFCFSHIRPANDRVASTNGVSSGPLSFLNVFDAATEAVKQGGTRRGANMGILHVHHPDIEAFIAAKDDLRRLTNFNLSVAITQDFLSALANNGSYDLIHPRTGRIVRREPAQRILDLIVDSAWSTGEPGVVFIDAINKNNPTPNLGSVDATNPCGEQPLLPYECCTLGSINLSRMASARGIMFNRLKRVVHQAVHFLDNVIEVNRYPLAEIEKASILTRKIGLGVMGFADMLIKLGIAYGSDAAVQQAETVMAFIHREARKASSELGRRRGNFRAYNGSVFDKPGTPFMRNATVTTIAPTGTISMVAGTSSGIEPIFAVALQRNVMEGHTMPEIHPLFVAMAKKLKIHTSQVMEEITRLGSVQGIAAVPSEIRRLFKTAHEIEPHWQIRMQAAFQKHTDNAVSKTINFPASATQQEVRQALLSAAELGCKGITIYRYGTRQSQVLRMGSISTEAAAIAPRPRPQRTHGITERISTGCGKLYVTINADEKGTCEVFAQMGKTGGCASSQIEAAGRLISLALRSGVKVEAIVKQLSGIRCPSPAWQNSKMVLSCPDAMAQVLQRVTSARTDQHRDTPNGMCPDCGGALAAEEGCLICHHCGFSKCS